MSDYFDGLLDPLSSRWEVYETAQAEKRKAEKLRDVLAESTAHDVGILRLALAKIIVQEDGVRSYGGNCVCAGKNSCSGHVTEVTKIARASLGLSALPDKARVPKPPPAPKKTKKKRKKAEL